jgi:hypothetical protein
MSSTAPEGLDGPVFVETRLTRVDALTGELLMTSRGGAGRRLSIEEMAHAMEAPRSSSSMPRTVRAAGKRSTPDVEVPSRVPIPFSAPEASPASAAARSAVTGVDDPASIPMRFHPGPRGIRRRRPAGDLFGFGRSKMRRRET